MSDIPLELEAVEAAARELDWVYGPQRLARTERAILAADEARGMRVEQEQPARFACRQCQEIANHQPQRYRLVSRWFPIKGPVDE